MPTRECNSWGERKKLMQHWADYLDGLKAGNNVIRGVFKRA